MTLWSKVFAVAYDPFLAVAERRGLADLRRELLVEARGRVVELGAGTGLNLPHYPAVRELVLTEPDEAMARKLERKRDGVVRAPAEQLPFEDGSVDTVVSTLVLCTVADLRAAAGEIRRILKPDGRLLFLEHVRSDDPRLAAWQDRLHRPWRAFACGCDCRRPTVDVLRGSGFDVDVRVQAAWTWMPAIVRPVVAGVATPS